MGHWEQVGRDNSAYRAQQARSAPLHRAIRNVIGTTILMSIGTALWMLSLAPLWRLIIG